MPFGGCDQTPAWQAAAVPQGVEGDRPGMSLMHCQSCIRSLRPHARQAQKAQLGMYSNQLSDAIVLHLIDVHCNPHWL